MILGRYFVEVIVIFLCFNLCIIFFCLWGSLRRVWDGHPGAQGEGHYGGVR